MTIYRAGVQLLNRITSLATDCSLVGNITAVGSFTSVTVSGSDLQHADIDTNTAVGDLVNLTSGTGATAGFYRITSVGVNAVTLDRAPGGAGVNIACTVYKDCVAIFATDATNGQRIMNYSHQNKPLQIGGDVLVATSSLTSDDVTIGGRIGFPCGTNDDGIVFGSLGTATKAIDLSASNLSGASDYQVYIGASDYWTASGKLSIADNFSLGGASFGTNAAKTQSFSQWTQPTTSPADVAQIGAADYQSAAGYTRLHQRTETGIVSSLALTSEIDALSNPRQPSQAVNMTPAASGSTGISRADDGNIDFGTANFALSWKGFVPDWTPAATIILAQKTDGTNGWNLQVLTTGVIRLTINTTNYDSTVAPQIVGGMVANIGVSVTRETASVAGSVVFYFNGYPLGASVTITAGAPTTVNNASLLYVLGTSAVRTAGQAHMFAPYNYALTAAQHLLAFRNGVDFADQWGSQTAKSDEAMAADFGIYNEESRAVRSNAAIGGQNSTVLTADATASNTHYMRDLITNFATTRKKFVVEVDVYIPSSNVLADGIQIAYDQALYEKYIISTTAGGDVQISADTWTTIRTSAMVFINDGAFDFSIHMMDGTETSWNGNGTDYIAVKNHKVYQVGATLALEPEGIQLDKWYDSSNNGLDASYPAAGSSLIRQPTKRLKQPAPTAKTTTVTLTIAELFTGILTGTHAAGATQTYTLPTGALVDAAGQFGINSYFDWTLINLSAAAADTITVEAGATHTVVGNMIVQSAHATTGALYGNSATFRTRKTAADTFVTYRIA